jgi:hypothetical protein
MSRPSFDPPRSFWPVAAFAFAALLWWVAFFFFAGQLGVYSDDWSFRRIDLSTGKWLFWSTPFERPYFWRPVLQLFLHGMFALCWDHMWIFHAANALSHAAAAALLYRLLRDLAVSRQASFAGSLFFLLFPFHYEVVFWATAMTTGVPTLLSLLLARLAIRHASGRDRVPWWAFSLLSFFMVCWYEQPGAILLGLPAIMLAASPGVRPARDSFRTAIVTCIACGVPMLVYIALLVTTAPPSVRGGSGSFISLAELPERWKTFSEGLRWHYATRLHHAWTGGLIIGWRTLGNVWGISLLTIAAACGGIMALAWAREPVAAPPWAPDERRQAITRRALVLAFGLIVSAAAWLPIIPLRGQIIEPRLNYFACVGYGTVAACLVDALVRRGRHRPWRPVLASCLAMGVVVASVSASVSMLGAQATMRQRTEADAAQARALGALAKDVPANTVFLTLEDGYTPANTGLVFFDRVLTGWLGAAWSGRQAIRAVTCRADLSVTARNMWIPLEIASCDRDGFVYTGYSPAIGTPVDGGTRLTWSQIVPYRVTPAGEIEVITTVTIRNAAGGPLEIKPPLAPQAARGTERSITIDEQGR